MHEINLTTRKKSAPPKVLGTFVKERNDHTGDVTYKVRYSGAYREEGHDFNKSFKVLRSAYWFKYEILDQDDIATFETLQFLCEREIPFTLEVLAERMKIGKTTLRQRLDNLQNAELLDITPSDGQGKPHNYILRTPLFERDSIINDTSAAIGRQNKILKVYNELPEKFIEDEAARLIRKVRKNTAKKLREIARRKEVETRHKKLYRQIKSELESKKLVWFSIVKRIGNAKAAALDSLVWRLAKSDFSNIETTAFGRILRERIKEYLKRLEIVFDSFFVDYVEKLFHFYSPQLLTATAAAPPAGTSNTPTAKPATEPPAAAEPHEPAPHTGDEQKELLQAVIEARRTGENPAWLPQTPKHYAHLFKEIIVFGTLKFAELEAMTKDVFTGDEWQKIVVEMRN